MLKKKLIFIILLVINATVSYAQNNEFEKYDNGLIYNKSTMSNLEKMVDSLNVKLNTPFNYCQLPRNYYTKYQGKGHYFKISNDHFEQTILDLKKNLPFDEFIIKYPKATVSKNLLIVKSTIKNTNNQNRITYKEISFDNNTEGESISIENSASLFSKKTANRYVYQYGEDSQYIEGFYFINELESKLLSEEYTRMIQYADCIIGSSQLRMLLDAKIGFSYIPENYSQFTKNEKELLLEQYRKTIVLGECSRDPGPRQHAIELASIAADVSNWEVFIRTHLDLMNDRIERAVDASYSQSLRKSYTLEMEALNLNIPDLLLGISIALENPEKNHYNGKTYRLGRAVAESKDKSYFEYKILSMISDANLDDYNRVLAFFLFENYMNYLENKQPKNKIILEKAINTLPSYLKEKIKI